jgi:hypothetical protein
MCKPEDYKYNKDIKISIKDLPAMMIKKLSTKSIHKAVGDCRCKMPRCEKSELTTEAILGIRKEYWLRKNFEKRGPSRNSYLKAKVESLWNEKEEKVEYRLAGRNMCQHGFISVIGCSKKKVQDMVKLCMNNNGTVVDKVIWESDFLFKELGAWKCFSCST